MSGMDAILAWLPNSPYTLYALGLLVWGVPFAVCYLIASVHVPGDGDRWAWILAPVLAAGIWSAFCLLFILAVLTDPDNVVYGIGVERAVQPLLFLILGDALFLYRAYRLRLRRQADA
jgi:predicted acyltransferase